MILVGMHPLGMVKASGQPNLTECIRADITHTYTYMLHAWLNLAGAKPFFKGFNLTPRKH
jgi:hypothetical protein